jgi:exonuclease VII large subunit
MADIELAAEEVTFNKDVVMMSVDDVEEHVREVVELQKALSDTRAKNEFQTHQLEVDHADAVRKLVESHEHAIADEKQIFDGMRADYERKVKDLLISIENKEQDHVKVTSELENRYEHKLAEQLDRFDRLSEEMELLKQKCKGMLQAERGDFTKQLNDLKNEARLREKKMRSENRYDLSISPSIQS